VASGDKKAVNGRFTAYLLGVFLLISVLSSGVARSEDSPQVTVLASIQPVYLISKELLVSTNLNADLLLDATVSPHHYALKISDRRKVQTADQIIWLGKNFEPWLAGEKMQGRNLALLKALGINDDPHHHGHDGHHHGEGGDPHIWLDPQQGLAVAEQISAYLSAAYPKEGKQIEQNLKALGQQLEAAEKVIAEQLAPHREKLFFVYHDAYSHFIARFHLREPAVLHPVEGQNISLKHLAELDKQAKSVEKFCFFVEPQFQRGNMPGFAQSDASVVAELDPVGASAESYPKLLGQFSRSMVDCLQQI